MKLFTKARDKKLNTNRRSGGGCNFSCRHPRLWSYIKSNVKAFFITGAITFVVSASATTILHSRQVRYKNDKSVEQAINELYEKADEIKYVDMNKIGCNHCTKLEYLESTGTQYIDTNFKGNQHTKITCESVISDEFKTGYYQGLFGATDVNGSTELNRNVIHMHRASASNLIIMAAYGNKIQIIGFSGDITKKHIYELDKNIYKVDNEIIYSYPMQTFMCTQNINIFRDNNSKSQDRRYCKMKLYSFKVYDAGVLVRDYVPVLDANDRPCLFDKVSKTCFYNQGTGEFLYG